MAKYQDLKDILLSKGFKFYSGKLNLNFIWERTNDVITNKFTDWLHIAYEDENNIQTVLTIPATTKPGIKGSTDSPITYEGVTGTAVICAPQQCGGAWEFRDTDQEFSKYPYFRQIKPINYWRDGDKDQMIDHVQQQNNKIFGTHWHKMSPNGSYGSGLVNNWSLGCMGSPEPEFKKILPLVRKSIPLHGKYFTGTIIYTA
jgi:hypothetical protein